LSRVPDLGRYWRTLATGLCFLIFTAGALFLSCGLLPLIAWVTRDRAVLRRRTRFFVQKFFRFITCLAEAAGCMRLKVEGVERLRAAGGVLIFANHPTLIDVVVLMGLIPQANCVIKSALFRKTALGRTLRSAGYVENADSAVLVEACCRSMDEGHAVIVFPEGTRTSPGQPLAFQRGPAHLLLASRRAFLPVVIRCRPAALLKAQPWYQVPERRFELELTVLEPVTADDWEQVVAAQPRPLAARNLTRHLERFFMSHTSLQDAP
jgi:1-acyl-sn-glycerol-3-phosphate acyltransferase